MERKRRTRLLGRWSPEARVILGAIGLSLVLVACSKAPDDARSRAEDALSRARAGEAEIYAPERYRAAADTLALAERELAAQENKFGLLRRYGTAEDLFKAAERAALAAAEQAAAAKEQARLDAERTLAEIQTKVEEVEQMMESSQGRAMLGSRKTGPAMRSLHNEMDQLAKNLANVEAALEEGRNRSALQMARAAKDQADVVHAEVKEAIETGTVPARGDK